MHLACYQLKAHNAEGLALQQLAIAGLVCSTHTHTHAKPAISSLSVLRSWGVVGMIL